MIRVRRVCGVEDHDLLLELQRACFPLDAPYDTARGWWWIAETVSDEIALAFGGLSETYADAQMGYLCRAGVVPEARGIGLQKRLIRSRIRYARTLGMREVVTDTADGNHASANSLIACGFKMYEPTTRWALPGSLYWRLSLLT